MMMKEVVFAYRVGDGAPVKMKLHHSVALGQTQLSGKTTALEAMLYRLNMPSIVFITKEEGQDIQPFKETGIEIPPFYSPPAEQKMWMYVKELIEAIMGEKVRFERYWVIAVSEGDAKFGLKKARTLQEVYANINKVLDSGKLKALDYGVFTNLREYLELILPEMQQSNLSSTLTLYKGINVMHLEHLSEQLQMLIIASTIEYVQKYYHNVMVVIPEAWSMLGYKGSPVKHPASRFIRKGASVGLYLGIDSQDLAGLDREYFRQANNFLIGRQTDKLEVQRNLDAMPMPDKEKPQVHEIQTLNVGFFYFKHGNPPIDKVYVCPAWMEEEIAIKVAKGEMTVEEALKHKKQLTKPAMEVYKPVRKPVESATPVARIIESRTVKDDDTTMERLEKELMEKTRLLTNVQDETNRLKQQLEITRDNENAARAEVQKLQDRVMTLEDESKDYELLKTVIGNIVSEAVGENKNNNNSSSSADGTTTTTKLQVTEEQAQIHADKTEIGYIAKLILEGHLDRQITKPKLEKILQERGMQIDNIEALLQQFCVWGFVRKKRGTDRSWYYTAVPEKKADILIEKKQVVH